MEADYCARLESAMKAASVGEHALASHLGVSYQAVKKVLNRSTNALTAANNQRAADLLKVSARWLAIGEGPRDAPIQIDPLEDRLLAAFRALGPRHRTQIVTRLESAAMAASEAVEMISTTSPGKPRLASAA